MTVERLRAGVIGVGSMGQNHVRVLRELPEANVVGVADADDSLAEEIGDKYGVPAVDTDELLERADAVVVAVPTQFHADLTERTIDAGVDVLVEKPFVEDESEGRRLVERADDAGVTLQVGHVERFNPGVETVQDVIGDRDLIAVDARRVGPPPDRTIADSAVLDLMIHDIDVLLALVDSEVETVSAVGARNNRHVTATFGFADGTMASLTASRVTQQKVRELSVTADDCRVNVDYTSQHVEIHRHSVPEYVETNGDVRYRQESVIEHPTVQTSEPLKRELSSFLQAAETGSTPEVTGEDGLRVLELAKRVDGLAAADRVKEVTLQ
jgi:predicted dehydrogenase